VTTIAHIPALTVSSFNPDSYSFPPTSSIYHRVASNFDRYVEVIRVPYRGLRSSVPNAHLTYSAIW